MTPPRATFTGGGAGLVNEALSSCSIFHRTLLQSVIEAVTFLPESLWIPAALETTLPGRR